MTVGLFIVAVWAAQVRILAPHEGPGFHVLGTNVMNAPGFADRCGPPRSEPFVVTVVHSPDKQAWLEAAAAGFMRRCPNTQITLLGLDDIEAAKQIAAGELTPTSWTPSDSLFLDYLQARADEPFTVEVRPSLLRSPVVIVAWSERVDVLERLLPAGVTGQGVWAGAACAGVARPGSPEWEIESTAVEQAPTWAGWWRSQAEDPSSSRLEQLEGWGPVKIRHASPTRASLGLLGLYLVTHDFMIQGAEQGQGREALATTLERDQPELRHWLRQCEAGQEPPLTSGRLLTDHLFNLGDRADGFDAVITDEHLTLSALERLEGRDQELPMVRVIYPQTSLVRDHPELQFEVDPGVGAAARRFGDYLRERDVQLHALQLGFRPTHTEVSLREYDLGPNPFTRLRRYGIELAPAQREAPRLGGASMITLLGLWGEATGRS